MILSLTDAKKYIYEKVEQISKETISNDEKMIVETAFEQLFFEKIEGSLSDEQLAQAKAETPEELDAYMFNNIPNYATLLEETTAIFLADYLADNSDEEELELQKDE